MKLICHVIPITWPYVGAMSIFILAHNSIMFEGALNLKRGKIKKKEKKIEAILIGMLCAF